jgi:hypothetical protein
MHTFEYYDPISKVSLNDRTRIITLEISKKKKYAEKPTNEMNVPELWAFYFEKWNVMLLDNPAQKI